MVSAGEHTGIHWEDVIYNLPTSDSNEQNLFILSHLIDWVACIVQGYKLEGGGL